MYFYPPFYFRCVHPFQRQSPSAFNVCRQISGELISVDLGVLKSDSVAILIFPRSTMPDYVRGRRRARIVYGNIRFSADPACNSNRCYATTSSLAQPPRGSLLCCRMLGMQTWRLHSEASRGVAQRGGSSIFPNNSTSSPASPFMSFCRCPLAFSSSSHSRSPSRNFASSAGLFFLHPNGLNRKPFCGHGGTGL